MGLETFDINVTQRARRQDAARKFQHLAKAQFPMEF